MRIAIEARSFAGASGVRTYTLELIRHLRAIASNNQIDVWRSPKTVSALPYVWLNYSIAKRIRVSKPDIVHFTKADVPSRKLVSTVVTIHDVIPLLLPESQSLLRRLYWPSALRRAVRMSDHIMTNSNASKQGIVELLGADPNKITVTPFAVDLKHFHPAALQQGTSPYILFVGRWDLRKNIPALIQAFARIKNDIPHQLVIAGRPADKPVNLKRVAVEEEVADRVLFRENVPYADLPALYAGADVFVYPSIIEGWGFPPQEAMACGTPVIVSNGDPLPEVVGNAGQVVPFSTPDLHQRLTDEMFVENLAQRIKQVLSDAQLRGTMSAQGLEHVKKFSWESVAAKTLQVYHQVTQ